MSLQSLSKRSGLRGAVRIWLAAKHPYGGRRNVLRSRAKAARL